MPQLDFAHYPFISQLFWLFFSFIVLYYFSAKIILPRISNIIETREIAVRNALEEARTLKEEANEYMHKYQSDLSEARIEADRILQLASNKIKEAKEAEMKKLDEEIEKQIYKAKAEIHDFAKSHNKELNQLTDNIFDNLVKKYIS